VDIKKKSKDKLTKEMGKGHYHEDPVCLLRSGSSHVMVVKHF
jgi:hypothetical protein